MKLIIRFTFILGILSGCETRDSYQAPIDRQAVVMRHNVVVTSLDSMGSLSVGNGEFTFTADFTGLQTFPDYYENGVSLGTMSQWGWDSSIPDEPYKLQDVAETFENCNGKLVPYTIQQQTGKAGAATRWLRANPHRLHLGMIGFIIRKETGENLDIKDCTPIRQELDLWSGQITSSFLAEKDTVTVILVAHPTEDRIAVHVISELVKSGQLSIQVRFPFGKECHTCAGYDWSQSDAHQSAAILDESLRATWIRRMSTTTYFASADWDNGTMVQTDTHTFLLTPEKERKDLSFTFQVVRDPETLSVGHFSETKELSASFWENYWKNGGFIDFGGSTDPRASELERRVILSQYLTRIQTAGSMPPQETGLTMNSWYGKFHLEMHWWHGVHFALWNRPELLERSMEWYFETREKARSTAEWQGYEGVRWQKMTGPNGIESPSNIGAFIIWQQPHFIYLSELLYLEKPDQATLEHYGPLVLETANFMADFIQYSEEDDTYHLCAPFYSAQEIFPATQTHDTPFELTYWHWGLTTAQKWRTRMGLDPDSLWNHITTHMANLPQSSEFYHPVAGLENAYDSAFRRDHPMVTGAYGMLPNRINIKPDKMRATLTEILSFWNWETTWGWDYPMLAMCAARLGEPELAVDALLMDVQKNTYLTNGHNYQDHRLRIYLPGNGALLSAVAMMAAGWEGTNGRAPGFPKDGSWKVKWEDINPMM